LTAEEQAMLAGDLGQGVQKAMEILTALGTIYGADGLVPVTSVQVAGVSYKNLGDAGLEFLADWAAHGARVRVPTTLNPAGLDLDGWRELGFDADFADKQARVIQAFAAMGIRTTCTCTPYFVGNVPRRGDHVAWAESSAVSFANSVLGARTNREGGPSALAAAITGRTPHYGLHLPENRRARLVVDVRCPVQSLADFGALGAIVGRVARNRVPYLKFRVASSELRVRSSEFGGSRLKSQSTSDATPNSQLATQADLLKALGAAMAASGAVALYHIESVTPEANEPDIIAPDAETFVVKNLAEGYAALDTRSAPGSGDGDEIDLVWIGCPHASLAELARVVELLDGRRVRSALWVTMAREVRVEAKKMGLVQALEAMGGRVVADTCLVVAPVKQLGFRHMATPSGKGAYYAPSHSGLAVHYGPLEACIEAAVSGEWRWGIACPPARPVLGPRRDQGWREPGRAGG
jgi:predicted aconitase